ncbi:TlyA family RNA methyltransferase [Frankia sp. CNm7]|uniref:TlyA family RNA methyltransferase n=1 Tax=Frankia nepalensis TaxID=1836974 RepID=A0A937RFB8_9ACTN|nr:TlyA family RNA methyltransferase [Frankia nepalensis]MBL7502605.1 TlyA family RNA methyltransferase [Frankia nepalensis]MBL7509372.1 TlyA family RNA methyltransferase [Frankia nepalensis]MBL7522341.1 TlyA family RNA methyltransferase [Frankia nepalensis]MBL7628962.1 TlyA family RNA methyltransferase [Frankia nepalensis]
MARRTRLDGELVRRGLARSREQAAEAIAAGRVLVAGRPASKPATMVDATTSIALNGGDDPGFASRGAHKLLGAFAAFGVPPLPETSSPGPAAPEGPGGPEEPEAPAAPADPGGAARGPALRVAGRRAMDVGASTGGFTDVLLRAGVASVVAVDVGYGQLDWRLRTDSRVRVLDRTNARHLTLETIGEPVDLVVGDLSFISLRLVLPALAGCAAPDADLVLLVKPQFEVGRERLGAGGVVRDVSLHAEAVQGVARAAAQAGLGVRGVVASPLPGPAGNVEYLLWLAAGAPPLDPAALAGAIAAGPAGAGGSGR